MSDASNPTRHDFWSSRYAAGTTPWDFRGVPAGLLDFLRRTPGGGRVLIPGCGSGYEVQAFYDAGFDVTAVDFSPVAIERARKRLGPLGVRVRVADFFADEFHSPPFDLIYERTFLCSMPPPRWPLYRQRMAQLLAPEGRLVGLFFYGREPSGPPFPITPAEMDDLFRDTFRLTRDEPVADSLPLFLGRERWQEWARI
jgi:SAM-dependent methyltransferase